MIRAAHTVFINLTVVAGMDIGHAAGEQKTIRHCCVLGGAVYVKGDDRDAAGFQDAFGIVAADNRMRRLEHGVESIVRRDQDHSFIFFLLQNGPVPH